MKSTEKDRTNENYHLVENGKVFPHMPPLILGETRSGKTSVQVMVIDKAILPEKK
jgi:hypothetical protein